jgi:hypothetical protein
VPPLSAFASPTPSTVFGFEVQHAFRFGPTAPLSTTREIALVLHTTEGHSDENALQTFHQRGDPPHWTMDGDSMFLCIPLDRAAKALRHDEPKNPANPRGFSPNSCAIQFEIAGFSKTKPWSLDDARLQRLAAAMAYSALHLGYGLEALAYPNPDWRDDKSDITTIWATNNTRRQWAAVDFRYPEAGPGKVWDHCSVPFQAPTNHFDCGALAIEGQILPRVRELVSSVLVPQGGDDLTDAELCEALNVDDIPTLKAIIDYAKGLRDGRNNRVPPLANQGFRYMQGYDDGQKLRLMPGQADEGGGEGGDDGETGDNGDGRDVTPGD